MPSFIDPGAGLNQLDFSQDSDFIFDSIFTYHPDDISQENGTSVASGLGLDTTESGPIVRLYGSQQRHVSPRRFHNLPIILFALPAQQSDPTS